MQILQNSYSNLLEIIFCLLSFFFQKFEERTKAGNRILFEFLCIETGDGHVLVLLPPFLRDGWTTGSGNGK